MQEGLQKAAEKASHTDPKKLAEELGLSVEAMSLLISGRATTREAAMQMVAGTLPVGGASAGAAQASGAGGQTGYSTFVGGTTLKTVMDEKGNPRVVEVKASPQENAAAAAAVATTGDTPAATKLAALATANPKPSHPSTFPVVLVTNLPVLFAISFFLNFQYFYGKFIE